MLDPFIVKSGVFQLKGTLDDETRKILKDNADAFLRAGGTISPRYWGELSKDSQAAFIEANNEIWDERCGKIGLAVRSLKAALSMIDAEKGMDAEAESVLDKVLSKKIQEQESKK